MCSFLIISGSFSKFLEYDSFIPESYSSFFQENIFPDFPSFKLFQKLEIAGI